LFVFNVSLDATNCTELWISPFDSIYGSLSNVSVMGFINVTNVIAANYNTSIPIRLSTMFGNIFFTGANRVVGYTGNSTGGQPYLNNINSSLIYSINGTAITVDNQTISGLTVRLVSEFDSTLEGLNASQIAAYKLTIPTYTPTITSMLAAHTIFKNVNKEWYENGTSANKVIYLGFNNTRYVNPMLDLYYSALQKIN
jgi:hypothetical protein